MKILLTLDYELFLGSYTGSVQNCLIVPIEKMLDATKFYNVKFTVFVDSLFIYQLEKFSIKYSFLKSDLAKVKNHLRFLLEQGHDIQLHVHPHWYYSSFNGEHWILDHLHYKLSDLSEDEVDAVFKIARNILEDIIGKQPIAFRAGGFSAQPSSRLVRLFKENGIRIDSSVCPGTYYNSSQQQYDYSRCPNRDRWFFEEDICQEQVNGSFLEIPITMAPFSPLFYWKLSMIRCLKLPEHKLWGDGQAIRATAGNICQRLLRQTLGMATIDGFKINYLKNIYNRCRRTGKEYFCIIGHPKLANPYSIRMLNDFCAYVNKQGDEFITIGNCLSD